jgi:2'-5' RNA ligase
MLPGDRLICAFVERQEVGTQFRHWFLHVTIVPWFRLDDSSAVITSGLTEALQQITQFEAVADSEARFGPRKRRVSLLRQPTPLSGIEGKVRTYLHKKRAWLVDATTKRHYGFRPHVTMQGEQELALGEAFWCDRLYIVEQKGDYKEIVSAIKLYGMSS